MTSVNPQKGWTFESESGLIPDSKNCRKLGIGKQTQICPNANLSIPCPQHENGEDCAKGSAIERRDPGNAGQAAVRRNPLVADLLGRVGLAGASGHRHRTDAGGGFVSGLPRARVPRGHLCDSRLPPASQNPHRQRAAKRLNSTTAKFFGDHSGGVISRTRKFKPSSADVLRRKRLGRAGCRRVFSFSSTYPNIQMTDTRTEQQHKTKRSQDHLMNFSMPKLTALSY